jgi:type IV pilus assembly protein PilB
MIEQAVHKRASDIHIEPMENKLRIRFRVDGVLQEEMIHDITLHAAMIARIKIISGLDISEKRKPQDGRATAVVDGQEYDIRVSLLPTVYGEKVVMRLTRKKGLTRDKKQLGFPAEELARFDKILSHPNGIILVTGPTGSGKSTTLYTALSELNVEGVNIITVEDPVEANIDGINQVQVNEKAGLTFASALRSILRQDPDIIMIGEIRDQETAEIAVKASITGHLVVSTLHTNSSASTITRLADMGVENYLIADSVVGIIAQRLVRKVCPDCSTVREADEFEKEVLGKAKSPNRVLIRQANHKDCVTCGGTGYFGRIGVYEVMSVTPELKKAISRGENADVLEEIALKDGMKTLRMGAVEYALRGITTVEEVKRITYEE